VLSDVVTARQRIPLASRLALVVLLNAAISEILERTFEHPGEEEEDFEQAREVVN